MTFIEHNHEPGKPRAIETVFKNYRMRSRLEARWGVFFETLKLQWEYEPEGFDLDGVWYLPDFKVKTPQGSDIWYEVKPKDAGETDKLDLLKQTIENLENAHARCEVLRGDPLDVLEKAVICPRCGLLDMNDTWGGYGKGYYAGMPGEVDHVKLCFPCDDETPYGGGQDLEFGFLGMPVRPHKGTIEVRTSIFDYAFKYRLLPAAVAARQARFEHGEKP